MTCSIENIQRLSPTGILMLPTARVTEQVSELIGLNIFNTKMKPTSTPLIQKCNLLVYVLLCLAEAGLFLSSQFCELILFYKNTLIYLQPIRI